MKKQKRAALFDDDADDPHVSGADDLHVNESFAKRFEHNARRAELHRLKEKHPEQYARLQARAALAQDDEQEEESTSDDEDDGFIEEETEAQILTTLKKLRSKDPEIYDSSKHFFPKKDDDDDDDDDADAKPKKAKPMLLKDVLFQQRVREADGEDSEDEENKQDQRAVPSKAYDKEQQQLRASFLQAAAPGSDDDDGLLQRVEGAAEDDDQDAPTTALLEEVFDPSDEKDRFLKDYIASKAWLREEDDLTLGEGPDLEEDAAFEEQAEAYEHRYNFRYEEPGSAKIVTHPRTVPSARLPDTRRAEQRARRAARKESEEEQRREEVKRLKNLKRQEIEARLAAIQEVAGRPTNDAEAMDAALLDELLQGDFDPAQYDELMARAFGEEYYEAEVEEDEAELAALADEDAQGAEDEADEVLPEAEDDAAALDDADDAVDADGPLTFKTLRARLRQAGQVGREDVARSRAEMQKLLEEYYKLDYEDHVGGVYTRFRYKQVPANDFGLDATDIFNLEDRQLNQIVSLKKLAPYREDADLIQPNHKMLRKLVGKKRQAGQAPAHADGAGEAAVRRQKGGGKRKQPPYDKEQGDAVDEAPAEAPAVAPEAGHADAPRKKKKKVAKPVTAPVDPAQARRESFAKPGAASWRHKGASTAGHKGGPKGHKGIAGAAGKSATQGAKAEQQAKQGAKAEQQANNTDGFSRNQRKNFKKRAARRAKHASQHTAA